MGKRAGPILVVLAVLAPAGIALGAVATTPPSAYALPAFEITTSGKSVRIPASDLGAKRTDAGLVIDGPQFDHAVAELTKIFGRHATPSTYELTDNGVQLVAGTPGFELDPAKTKAMLLRAIQGHRSNLKLPTRKVEPAGPPQWAIVVRLREFALDLYEGPKLRENFPVGVGALRFPTPPGAYHIRSKAKNPSWRNPGSSWARSMPRYIPPGPRNPLGTRALRLDRGALVIHGTPQPWSVGRRSSHGCIRMKRPDVEHLFDVVPEGTPVFIVP